MVNAAADASPPIATVWIPPRSGRMPVKVPLKYPKTKSASSVTATDVYSAVMSCGITMYGASGTSPPTMYDIAMVKALERARFGSGASMPSSNAS